MSTALQRANGEGCSLFFTVPEARQTALPYHSNDLCTLTVLRSVFPEFVKPGSQPGQSRLAVLSTPSEEF
jgi:hypothetical protein